MESVDTINSNGSINFAFTQFSNSDSNIKKSNALTVLGGLTEEKLDELLKCEKQEVMESIFGSANLDLSQNNTFPSGIENTTDESLQLLNSSAFDSNSNSFSKNNDCISQGNGNLSSPKKLTSSNSFLSSSFALLKNISKYLGYPPTPVASSENVAEESSFFQCDKLLNLSDNKEHLIKEIVPSHKRSESLIAIELGKEPAKCKIDVKLKDLDISKKVVEDESGVEKPAALATTTIRQKPNNASCDDIIFLEARCLADSFRATSHSPEDEEDILSCTPVWDHELDSTPKALNQANVDPLAQVDKFFPKSTQDYPEEKNCTFEKPAVEEPETKSTTVFDNKKERKITDEFSELTDEMIENVTEVLQTEGKEACQKFLKERLFNLLSESKRIVNNTPAHQQSYPKGNSMSENVEALDLSLKQEDTVTKTRNPAGLTRSRSLNSSDTRNTKPVINNYCETPTRPLEKFSSTRPQSKRIIPTKKDEKIDADKKRGPLRANIPLSVMIKNRLDVPVKSEVRERTAKSAFTLKRVPVPSRSKENVPIAQSTPNEKRSCPRLLPTQVSPLTEIYRDSKSIPALDRKLQSYIPTMKSFSTRRRSTSDIPE